mmetsp:Transcript_4527/g.7049  ORF Transcript_4527/g.7049 Transcript_4527/m.7049 type:complete len:157 (-) Transcript_4527:351-821(-)
MTGNHHHHVLVGPGKAATKKLEKFRTSWTERNPTADSNYNPIENLPTYARDDLIISNLLGQGGFSNVFQAQTTTTTDNTTDEQQQQQQQQQEEEEQYLDSLLVLRLVWLVGQCQFMGCRYWCQYDFVGIDNELFSSHSLTGVVIANKNNNWESSSK